MTIKIFNLSVVKSLSITSICFFKLLFIFFVNFARERLSFFSAFHRTNFWSCCSALVLNCGLHASCFGNYTYFLNVNLTVDFYNKIYFYHVPEYGRILYTLYPLKSSLLQLVIIV